MGCLEGQSPNVGWVPMWLARCQFLQLTVSAISHHWRGVWVWQTEGVYFWHVTTLPWAKHRAVARCELLVSSYTVVSVLLAVCHDCQLANLYWQLAERRSRELLILQLPLTTTIHFAITMVGSVIHIIKGCKTELEEASVFVSPNNYFLLIYSKYIYATNM